MKMSRFCTKKEIPCHQHGKQGGKLELTPAVVMRSRGVAVVLLIGSGVRGDSVTAAKNHIVERMEWYIQGEMSCTFFHNHGLSCSIL